MLKPEMRMLYLVVVSLTFTLAQHVIDHVIALVARHLLAPFT
jgi:hypothetical protein